MAQQSESIDFDRLKRSVAFQEVLLRYGLHLKPNGPHELRGPCPIHGGDNDTAFMVNLETQSYYCFTGCKKGGDVFNFVSEMEKVPLGKAARILEENHALSVVRPPTPSSRPEKKPRPFHAQFPLDPNHPSLDRLGIDSKAREVFGIGHCRHDVLKDRVAFPIHDEHGVIVSYCGRRIGEDGAKYKHLPGFPKSAVLYNLHRVKSPRIVLVEGFKGVWALHLHRIPAVAAMGSDLSPLQARLLERFQLVVILYDGDDAGRKGARGAIDLLVRRTAIRVVELPEGSQPDTVAWDWLREKLIAAGIRRFRT